MAGSGSSGSGSGSGNHEKNDKFVPAGYTGGGSGVYDPFSVDVSSMLSAGGAGLALQNPLLDLGGPELLFQDEMIGGVRKTSWNEKMFYGVGTTYLFGLTAGGAWGFVEGVRNPDATSARLKFNTVLNSMTRRGPFLGNSLGVLSLMYHCVDGAIVAARGSDDYINNIAAASLAGAVFKSTAGLRATGLATLIGGGFMAAYTAAASTLGL